MLGVVLIFQHLYPQPTSVVREPQPLLVKETVIFNRNLLCNCFTVLQRLVDLEVIRVLFGCCLNTLDKAIGKTLGLNSCDMDRGDNVLLSWIVEALQILLFRLHDQLSLFQQRSNWLLCLGVPLFRGELRASCECIGTSILCPRAVDNLNIKGGKFDRAARLSPVEDLRSCEVFQVLMVSVDQNWVLRAFQVVSP